MLTDKEKLAIIKYFFSIAFIVLLLYVYSVYSLYKSEYNRILSKEKMIEKILKEKNDKKIYCVDNDNTKYVLLTYKDFIYDKKEQFLYSKKGQKFFILNCYLYKKNKGLKNDKKE